MGSTSSSETSRGCRKHRRGNTNFLFAALDARDLLFPYLLVPLFSSVILCVPGFLLFLAEVPLLHHTSAPGRTTGPMLHERQSKTRQPQADPVLQKVARAACGLDYPSQNVPKPVLSSQDEELRIAVFALYPEPRLA